MTKKASEFRKFEEAAKKIFSVSHEELQKREEDWKKEKESKKRAKASPASRVGDVRV